MNVDNRAGLSFMPSPYTPQEPTVPKQPGAGYFQAGHERERENPQVNPNSSLNSNPVQGGAFLLKNQR